MSAVLNDPLLRLRLMTEEDVATVMEIEASAYSHPWTEGIFLDCLRVGYCCWVCELEDNAVAGYGIMSVAAGECHILNVCIRPGLQSRGLGRKMLNRLLNVGRQHHADTAFLEVRHSNAAAIGLYLSEGFNEVGLRKGYYPHTNGREDALVFAKSLI